MFLRHFYLKPLKYISESSYLGECVNYNVLLKRLSRLRSMNINLINSNSNLNPFNTNTYVWSKYSSEKSSKVLESIDNVVNTLINSHNVGLLDSCKLLLNFTPNYKFIQLISSNIDFYGNINNLYYLLKYVLTFNTLRNTSSSDSKHNNCLIYSILNRMCFNFGEMDDKVQTLDLLYNFNLFHEDYTLLIYNYFTNLNNIDVLKHNITLILNYFYRYNTLINIDSHYDVSQLLDLYINHGNLNGLTNNQFLTVFRYLLQTNLANKYLKHFKHVLMNIKFNKLSHIISFFDSLHFNSYPYLFYLSQLDNSKILTFLTRNIDLIGVNSLIAITNIYLLYFNGLTDTVSTNSYSHYCTTVEFTKFLNRSLTQIFNYYHSVVPSASLFKRYDPMNQSIHKNSTPHTDHLLSNSHEHTKDPIHDEHVSQDSLLKLTRYIDKLLYNIRDLNCLSYTNLQDMFSFLCNYHYLVKFLTTPFSNLCKDYLLFNAHVNAPKSTRNTAKNNRDTLIYFNDFIDYGLNDYLLIQTPTNSSFTGNTNTASNTTGNTGSCNTTGNTGSCNTTGNTTNGGTCSIDSNQHSISKLHSEISNVLSYVVSNASNVSNEVTIGPYKVDILLTCS